MHKNFARVFCAGFKTSPFRAVFGMLKTLKRFGTPKSRGDFEGPKNPPAADFYDF